MNSQRSVKKAYKDFLSTDAGTRAYAEFKRVVYTENDSLVAALNQSLEGAFSCGKRVLGVCDIGGGDGKRIKGILQYAHRHLGVGFNLDFVEQSPCLMRQFDETQIADFTITRKFQTLFEDAALMSSYDLIFLIHSIFAFADSSSLDKLLGLMAENGRIVIVSNGAGSFLGGLKRILDRDFTDGRFEISDLTQSLVSRGVRFQSFGIQTKWRLNERTLKAGMETVLNWLSLGRYVNLGHMHQREIWRYIEKNSCDNGGGFSFTEDEQVLIVSQ